MGFTHANRLVPGTKVGEVDDEQVYVSKMIEIEQKVMWKKVGKKLENSKVQ